MTGRFALILLLVFAFVPEGRLAADDGASPPPLAATDDTGLRAAQGKTVVVRGKVTRTGKAKATGVNFLNFASGDFTVVTFGKSLKDFPDGEPADVYQDKFIEIRGTVTFYKEKPQIELTSPEQIKIIDAKTAAEALAPKATDGEPGKPDGDAKPLEGTAEKPRKVDPKNYFSD